MELYGTEGTLYVPDPNFFGGSLEHAGQDGCTLRLPDWDHPFGRPNEVHSTSGKLSNYRSAGLAEMAHAIVEDRPHRCSLDLARHAIGRHDLHPQVSGGGGLGFAFDSLQPTGTSRTRRRRRHCWLNPHVSKRLGQAHRGLRFRSPPEGSDGHAEEARARSPVICRKPLQDLPTLEPDNCLEYRQVPQFG